jgi:hypothetical protein
MAITITNLKRRVEKGATLLDEKRPGWWRKIKVTDLDVADTRRCILGWAFQDALTASFSDNGYDKGLEFLWPDKNDDQVEKLSVQHGFDRDYTHPHVTFQGGMDVWDMLGALWSDEVRARRRASRNRRTTQAAAA